MTTNQRRALVFSRDKGICARCGVDCNLLTSDWRKLSQATREYLERLTPLIAKAGFWHADHIQESADGGDNALENLQTLCRPCHLIKTREAAEARTLRALQAARASETATAGFNPFGMVKMAAEDSVMFEVMNQMRQSSGLSRVTIEQVHTVLHREGIPFVAGH